MADGAFRRPRTAPGAVFAWRDRAFRPPTQRRTWPASFQVCPCPSKPPHYSRRLAKEQSTARPVLSVCLGHVIRPADLPQMNVLLPRLIRAVFGLETIEHDRRDRR